MVQGECIKGIGHYWNMNLGTTDPLTEWEAFKTTLRGTFMSITGALRKNTQKSTEELESTMLAAESAYVRNLDPNTRDTWLYRYREYELHLLDLTQKRMLHSAQKTFEHGKEAGRLLAYLTRSEYSPLSIPRILPFQGQISDIPQDIVETFLTFVK